LSSALTAHSGISGDQKQVTGASSRRCLRAACFSDKKEALKRLLR